MVVATESELTLKEVPLGYVEENLVLMQGSGFASYPFKIEQW